MRARRAGFDEAWRGPAVDLSEKGTQVGAPVAAAGGTRMLALYAQRPKATAPWRVFIAEWERGGEPKRAELATGTAQAQGPGIAALPGGCFIASWVEGSGKATCTMLGRWCSGQVAGTSLVALSRDGVEGGRAALASDATTGDTFAVWQEIPAGKPAELRVAKLGCR